MRRNRVAEVGLRDVVFGQCTIVRGRRGEDGIGAKVVRARAAVIAAAP